MYRVETTVLSGRKRVLGKMKRRPGGRSFQNKRETQSWWCVRSLLADIGEWGAHRIQVEALNGSVILPFQKSHKCTHVFFKEEV